MLPLYKIAVNVAKGKFTHVILHRVNPITEDVIESNIKLKIGKNLIDQANNLFKVNGYYGDYIILRAEHLGSHPVGNYLTEK